MVHYLCRFGANPIFALEIDPTVTVGSATLSGYSFPASLQLVVALEITRTNIV